MILNILVEGYVDEAIARRLIHVSGNEAGVAYGKKGWTYIQQKVAAFNRTCGAQGLLTLVDLMDTKRECPAEVLKEWLPHCDEKHVFRVVVREVESWILADRSGLAGFLNIPPAKLSFDPELEADPKQTLINLARGSRSKAIRDALVPKNGQSASEGPLYSSELIRFVAEKWDPLAAQANSASLAKCLVRLVELEARAA